MGAVHEVPKASRPHTGSDMTDDEPQVENNQPDTTEPTATAEAEEVGAAQEGKVLPAPAATGGRAPGSPAQVRLGEAVQFDWPVPDRTVEVQGRRLALEVAVVGALHGILALWLLWAVRDLASALPDAITGLFSDEFSFLFGWAVLAIATLVLYVVAGLGWCAVLLLRGDPVGRGLAVVISGMLTMMLFSDGVPSAVVVTWLVSVAGVSVLFLSPWAARTFDEGARRHERPVSVVTAQTLALSYLSLIGLVAVLLLPGLRFVGEIGVDFVVLLVLYGVSAVVGVIGVRKLGAGPDRTARLMVTGGVAASLVAVIVGGQGGETVALTVAVLAGTVAPLWVAPRARVWFGDGPLTSPGPGSAQRS